VAYPLIRKTTTNYPSTKANGGTATKHKKKKEKITPRYRSSSAMPVGR
jgi:hypothetical protein